MDKGHPKVSTPVWVHQVNDAILTYLGHHNDYISLGPGYSDLTFKDAEWNLQLHRMHKKFEKPDDTRSTERKHNSLWAMVEYDASGLTDFCPSRMDLDPFVRHQLYNVRSKLNEIISDYRFSVSALEFPSGETYVSANGDISLYAKLRDIEQWTCTLECFDLFARVCYNTPMLKYAAKRHFAMHERNLGKRYDERRMWRIAMRINKGNRHKSAYMVFHSKLRSVITIVDGARLTTVPKEVEADRVITCEPFCNMIVQRTIEIDVRRLINKHFGIDLDESQILHKTLIADLDNATIDLKNASNSIFIPVIKWFFGNSLLGKHLFQARSAVVEVENGMGWQLNMLSPMGNGYTFGVMTLLLLCITRQFDDFSHVFGDDIIVHCDVALDVIDTLKVLGFSTNTKKTFTEGFFRESCGGFTSHGRYITSFSLEWAEDEVDAVVLTNKIGIMAFATNSQLRTGLQKLHSSLIDVIPPSLFRCVKYRKNYAASKVYSELESLKYSVHFPQRLQRYHYENNGFVCVTSLSGSRQFFSNDRFSLSDGVYVRQAVLRKNQSETSKRKTQQFLRSQLHKDLQLGGEQYVAFLSLTKRSEVYRKKKGNTPLAPVRNVSRLFGWYYIWAGKIQAPNLRDTYISEKWQTLPLKVVG